MLSLPDHSSIIKEVLPDPEIILDALEKVAEFGIPVPTAARLLDLGTTDFLNYFEQEVLDELIFHGGATCRFFEGVYGSGKTHLLQLLYDLALKKGMAVVRIELSQALKLEQWQLVTSFILENIEFCFNGQQVRSLPNILDSLRGAGMVKTKLLQEANLPHSGFQTGILIFLKEPLTDLAKNRLKHYLLGEKIGAGELRKIGVRGVKNPLCQRNAEQVLNTALNSLFYLGLPGVLLLFDETDKSFDSRRTVPPKKVQIAANLIRRFIDGCATGGLIGTVAVFAVLPGFLENCARIYPALGQRLQMVRGGDEKPAWRWPVLPIQAVCSISQPEHFLEAAINRFEKLVAHCGGSVTGLRKRMQLEGYKILNQNAGMGYRRDLMKVLATLALEKI